ncbi:hypothetical protein DFH08DRAFT_351537 [Mycena albidolilacea]|uniref:Uncharacterized protein n=1 Tax=Mycena albidolilacea TaxID=1033008 RepID=A0AAD6ZH47_9AGAR|nr:hypothetical protein DFH08DRAFT_351537 [Mycena albidolilacea]
MWDTDDPATHYLETTITPSLRMLEVPETFLRPSPIDTLRIFISKSGCRLQGLCTLGKFAPRPCIVTHSPPPFRSFHSTRLSLIMIHTLSVFRCSIIDHPNTHLDVLENWLAEDMLCCNQTFGCLIVSLFVPSLSIPDFQLLCNGTQITIGQ